MLFWKQEKGRGQSRGVGAAPLSGNGQTSSRQGSPGLTKWERLTLCPAGKRGGSKETAPNASLPPALLLSGWKSPRDRPSGASGRPVEGRASKLASAGSGPRESRPDL